MGLKAENFSFLTEKIKDLSGIFLSEDKEYLLESRLLVLIKKYNKSDINAFVEHIKINQDSNAWKEIIECITTNESFFFRDIKPFEILCSEVMPKITASPDKSDVKIWSAASSTGQEAYSIIMSLLENPKYQNMSINVLGTDIDTTTLEKARGGVYTQFEIQRGIPIPLLLKYFEQIETQWKVKSELSSRVKFDQFNLVSDRQIKKFDIIFCRNVLIYFDKATKEKVLHSLSSSMNENSVLFLGTAESLVGLDTNLMGWNGHNSIVCLKK